MELTTEFSLSVDGDHPAMVHMVQKADEGRHAMANKVHVLQCDVGSRALETNPDVHVRRVERFDERVDEMCADAERTFDLIYLRGQKSLNWRYADPRAGKYTILAAEEATASSACGNASSGGPRVHSRPSCSTGAHRCC